jgi:hypothetical protein
MSDTPSLDWEATERALEVEVSQIIRAMPFLWLAIPNRADGTSDRGSPERNCIALISTLAGGRDEASASWLGRYAQAPKIRGASLWNVNHVTDTFDPASLDIAESYVRAMPRL